ncbi:MAG: ArsB/NhaD family transporter [Thermosipho sp. (in: Bacteria)]|nr:ArsB/NhaD family transporter [Thermosipho sp. (in: thermotogales)]
MSEWLAIILFFIAYYFIIFKKEKASVTTFLIGLMIGLLKIGNLKIENASEFIDFNTISLLIGMMIIVSILKSTGFFQFVAIKIVKISRSNIYKLLFFLYSIIFLFSAFLDNVTTIILFTPIILLICDSAEIDPKPIIFLAIISSNIGGLSTLIGDPPNILIGSAAKISFIEFIKNMFLPSIIAFLLISFFIIKRIKFPKHVNSKLNDFIQIEPSTLITDKKLMKKSILTFAIVVTGFVIHEYVDYELSLIALTGAAFLLLLSNKNFETISKDIEWDTIFFFIGLFSITYALEIIGLTNFIANQFLYSNFSEVSIVIFIFIISFFLSGFVGAVPSTMILIPVVQKLIFNGLSYNLWWAIALGAGFGGNLTPVGAASNIVGLSLLEKHQQKHINFFEYLKTIIIPLSFSFFIAIIYLVAKELL